MQVETTNTIEKKVDELEIKFEGLKEIVAIYQHNIDNNITWFYASIAIVVAILLASLYFLIKNAVNAGIEKGIKEIDKKIIKIIKENPPYRHARGNTNVVDNQFLITGLQDFNLDVLVSLEVYNRDGKELSRNIQLENESITVKLMNYDPKEDGLTVYWNIVWRNGYEFL